MSAPLPCHLRLYPVDYVTLSVIEKLKAPFEQGNKDRLVVRGKLSDTTRQLDQTNPDIHYDRGPPADGKPSYCLRVGYISLDDEIDVRGPLQRKDSGEGRHFVGLILQRFDRTKDTRIGFFCHPEFENPRNKTWNKAKERKGSID